MASSTQTHSHCVVQWEDNKNESELDELRQKLKDGTITDEEKKRLKELEDWELEQKRKELEELRNKKP